MDMMEQVIDPAKAYAKDALRYVHQVINESKLHF